MKNSALYFSIKNQIKKDHTQERSDLFSVFLSSHLILKYPYQFLELHKLSPLRALFCFIYAACVSGNWLTTKDTSPITIEKRANESNKIRELESVLRVYGFKRASLNISFFKKFSSFFYFLKRAARSPLSFIKTWKWLLRLNQNFPFYVCLRATETLFIFLYLNEKFQKIKPSALLISTEGNPHGSAVMGIADKFSIPLIFASHGAISTQPVKIKCELGLFHGAKMREDYLREFSKVESTIYYGRKKNINNDSNFSKKICLCLSKDPNLLAIKNLLLKIKNEFVGAEILLRPHPQSMVSVSSIQKNFPFINISKNNSLAEDLSGSFLVLAGNSTVHLEALSYGVASLFWQDLDMGRQPLLSFLKEGIVFSLQSNADISEAYQNALKIYSDPLWRSKLSQYVNLNESEEEFLQKFHIQLADILPIL